jgi:hypothetical protein
LGLLLGKLGGIGMVLLLDNRVGSNLVVFYFLANQKRLAIGYGFVNFGFVVQ